MRTLTLDEIRHAAPSVFAEMPWERMSTRYQFFNTRPMYSHPRSMTMGKFGWSYPPGCSGTPFDEEEWCACCGQGEFSCICPECPVCYEAGNPACYDPETHNLVYSQAQEESYDAACAQTEADNAADAAFWEEWERDQQRALEWDYREVERIPSNAGPDFRA